MPKGKDLLPLFPATAEVNRVGHLVLGGVDVASLAAEFGTPLYIFDEATLRERGRSFVEEFGKRFTNTLVIYACKAFVNPALARIFAEEGLGLDVVSGGEMAIAHSVEFPMEKVYFHGNNKSREELELALEWGVGRIVVDNLYEMALLEEVAGKQGKVQPILLRLTPNIDPHTHRLTTTGILDSKFGFPLATGQAQEAVRSTLSSPHLRLIGLHFHLGSPIYEVEPYVEAIGVVMAFAGEIRRRYNLALEEFSPGGGFAIQYTLDRPPPLISNYAQVITQALTEKARALGFHNPRLVIEPGRAIVGPAGVALYSVGAVKDIPGVRRYASLDGGMADNIRPALYGARYEAALANNMEAEATEVLTLAGKYCESGDILVKDIPLPSLKPGDLVALPAAGAYCLAMASNYNASLRPAIVIVSQGKARLLRRRQSYQDLVEGVF